MAVAQPRVPLRRLVFIVLVVALAVGLLVIASAARARFRTTPVYEPPVLAGQPVACTAGFYARRGETPPLEERLRYKFQSTAVTERCTLLAARIFKATGAAGLSEDLPFGGILADLMAGRQHISNQYEYVGSSWGGVMFGLESKDLMI